MNKFFYFVGFFKLIFYKIIYPSKLKLNFLTHIKPSVTLQLDRGSTLILRRNIKIRSYSSVSVRKNALCDIGDNVFFNKFCSINCHESIKIGNSVLFGESVKMYDHDHKYSASFGVDPKKYTSEPIHIGESCWIGSGVIILKGTILGENSVVGAGTVLKGYYPPNSLIYSQKEIVVKHIL